MRGQKFTHDGKFLSPLTSRIAAFYAGFIRVTSERRVKHEVHQVVHHPVHLIDSGIHRRMKQFDAKRCSFWARAGRVVGWNDPAFSSLARPKRVSGSFQPTLAVER